jgi:CheY-like chemotaxis protein
MSCQLSCVNNVGGGRLQSSRRLAAIISQKSSRILNAEVFMASILVLAVGLDRSLLATRTLVLEFAGYMVVSASSVKEGVGRLQAGDFDLVILCHSIPAKERERLSCLIRASGSHIPIVSIAGTQGQHDAFANATLGGSDTKKLLSDLRETLNRAAKGVAGEIRGPRDKRESA